MLQLHITTVGIMLLVKATQKGYKTLAKFGYISISHYDSNNYVIMHRFQEFFLYTVGNQTFFINHKVYFNFCIINSTLCRHGTEFSETQT